MMILTILRTGRSVSMNWKMQADKELGVGSRHKCPIVDG